MTNGFEFIAFNNEISQTTYTELITVNQEMRVAIPDYNYADNTSDTCDVLVPAQVAKYSLTVSDPQVIASEPIYNSCEILNPSITIHWSDIPTNNLAIYSICAQVTLRDPNNVTKTRIIPITVNGYKVLNRPNIQYSTTWYNNTNDTRDDFSEVLNRNLKKLEVLGIIDGKTKKVVGQNYVYTNIQYGLDKQDYLTLTLEQLPPPHDGIIQSISIFALANSIGDISGTGGPDNIYLNVDLKYKRDGQYKFFNKQYQLLSFEDGAENIAVWKKIAVFNLDLLTNDGLDQNTSNNQDMSIAAIETTLNKIQCDIYGTYAQPCYPVVKISEMIRGSGTNEIQYFSIPGATSGFFTIEFRGETTVPIGYGASAADVRNALVVLSTIGVDNIRVVGDGTVSSPYTLTFINDLGGQNLPLISVNGDNLAATVPIIITELYPGTYNERQRIAVPANVRFTVSYQGATTPIVRSPSNYQLRVALETILGTGNVSVISPNGFGNNSQTTHNGPWDVDFIGLYRGQNVDQLQVTVLDQSPLFSGYFSSVNANVIFMPYQTKTLYPVSDIRSLTNLFWDQDNLNTQLYSNIDEIGSPDNQFIFTRGSTLDTVGSGLSPYPAEAYFHLGGLVPTDINRLISVKFNYAIDNCSNTLDKTILTFGIALNSTTKELVRTSPFAPWYNVAGGASVSGTQTADIITDNQLNNQLMFYSAGWTSFYMSVGTTYLNAPYITRLPGGQTSGSVNISGTAKNKYNKLNAVITYEPTLPSDYGYGQESPAGVATSALTIRTTNYNTVNAASLAYFTLKKGSSTIFVGTRKFKIFIKTIEPSASDIESYKYAVQEMFDFIKTQTLEQTDVAFDALRFIALSPARIKNEVHPPAMIWKYEVDQSLNNFSRTLNGTYFNNAVNGVGGLSIAIIGTQDSNGIVTTLWQGGTGINEKQRVDASAARGGTYTLSFDSCVTAPIRYNANAADVHAAFNAVTCFDANNIIITDIAPQVYDIEFINQLGRTDLPLLKADTRGLLGAIITPMTRIDGVNGNQEIQLIQISNAKSGTYKLGYAGVFTDPIPFNASAKMVQDYLYTIEALRYANMIVYGETGGAGVPGGPYMVIFGEGRGNFTNLTADITGLSCSDTPLDYIFDGPYEYDLNIPSETFEEDTTFRRTLTPSGNISKSFKYQRDLIDPNTKINGVNATVKDVLIIKNNRASEYNTYKYNGSSLSTIPQSDTIKTGLSIVAINKTVDSVRSRELIIRHLQTKRGILPARMQWDAL